VHRKTDQRFRNINKIKHQIVSGAVVALPIGEKGLAFCALQRRFNLLLRFATQPALSGVSSLYTF
jgi:hypothetical protein